MSQELDPVISMRNVNFFYDEDVQALKDITLDIYEGEFIGIIGQNGAGKSTLLKNIIGLLKPSSGHIEVLGRDIREINVSRMSLSVGFVLQNPDLQLFADTVKEEIAFGLENLGYEGREKEEKINQALSEIGIEHLKEEFPPSLSKGDRAKVVIASVLAMDPPIIIFDEPTSGQDYNGCRQILDIAMNLNEEGKTIIMVTHNMNLIAEYTERLLVLKQGELFMEGSLEEVFSRPDKLLETNIKPPKITQIAQELEADISELSMHGDILTPDECGERLAKTIHEREGGGELDFISQV